MQKCYQQIVDAIDIETFFICQDEEEGRELTHQLMESFGLKDTDIVFIEHVGPGARVRARGYIYRAGDRYGWLGGEAKNE